MNYNALRRKYMKVRSEYMRITAEDISCKQFPTKPEGLEPDEVYAFLEVIKEEIYELNRKTSVLKEKVSLLTDKEQIMNSAILSILLLLDEKRRAGSKADAERILDNLFNILSPLRENIRPPHKKEKP